MGLTTSSTGKEILNNDFLNSENTCDFTVALARKP